MLQSGDGGKRTRVLTICISILIFDHFDHFGATRATEVSFVTTF